MSIALTPVLTGSSVALTGSCRVKLPETEGALTGEDGRQSVGHQVGMSHDLSLFSGCGTVEEAVQ
jgi:hypothetical protein